MQAFATKSRAAPQSGHLATRHAPLQRTPAVRAILRGPRVQPKLTVGAVNDPAEREADRVADQVMRMAAGSGIQRVCAHCNEESKGSLQRRATDAQGLDAPPPSVHAVLRSSGRPLDAATRAFMEPRFARGFGDVRIHTGAQASASARDAHARAYTSGRDVVFAEGQFAPQTAAGRTLLAHELTHVMQQSGGSPDPAVVARQIDEDALDAPVRRQPAEGVPYREAVETNECIRIMGEENADYCRQAVMSGEGGAGLSRSPRSPSVTMPLTIVLTNVGIVPQARIVEEAIRQAYGPIAPAAGRQLRVSRSPPGDLELDFDHGGHQTRPCGSLVLGNEGGGEIFIGAHEDLSICSGAQGGPDDADRTSQFEPIFRKDEPEFARFVGATAVHELAHLIARLPHSSDPDNFMHSDGKLGDNLPPEVRTLASMRAHWTRQMSFSADQISLLKEAIRTGRFTGGATMTSVPATPPISPKRPRKP